MIGSLTAVFGLALLYALLISIPAIKALDDDMTTRWMITAGGVALVIVVATLEGPADMLTLFVHFGVACIPFWGRAAYFHREHQRRQELQAAKRGETLQSAA